MNGDKKKLNEDDMNKLLEDIPVTESGDPIEAFKIRHARTIGCLMEHFKKTGRSYESIDALLADMLDDVIDIWEKAHRDVPCQECEDSQLQGE